MKNTLCLFIATAFLASCGTNVTEETDKIAGKWLREGNRLNKGYMAGNQRDYDIVKKFMDAYENMEQIIDHLMYKAAIKNVDQKLLAQLQEELPDGWDKRIIWEFVARTN